MGLLINKMQNQDPCKHLRSGGARVENGYNKICLSCGYEWFEEDKPLTEDEEVDRKRFDHAEKLGLIK